MKGDEIQVQHPHPLTFQPHPLARNRHFQTIASSFYWGQGLAMRRVAREMILAAGEGVRLQGYYSPQTQGQAKGLVLLLHGWLGSAQASYVITIGEYLYRHGYAIFRLNLRDHGETHQLNPGLFRGDLLAEVFAAAQQIARLESNRPFYFIGASLGGNFALRLAWRHCQNPLPNLSHTIAISPVLNPHHTTLTLDTGPRVYLAYFRRKWCRSLQKKKVAYPTLYDFAEIMAARTCMAMTEIFVRRYTPYPDVLAYFASYTVTPAMLADLHSPVTMITAADDPIVPVSDFYPFGQLPSPLQVYIQPHGGHVGFINILPYRCWANDAIHSLLESQPR